MYNNSGLNKVILVGTVVTAPRWHTEGDKRYLCIALKTVES